MIYQWVDVNVDLSILVKAVNEFFEGEGFKTRVDELSDGWIVWAVKVVDDNPKSVSVKVSGRREDFTIEFSSGSKGKTLAIFGSLFSFFGLGTLVQQETKWLKFFENLEQKFWSHMEITISTIRV